MSFKIKKLININKVQFKKIKKVKIQVIKKLHI